LKNEWLEDQNCLGTTSCNVGRQTSNTQSWLDIHLHFLLNDDCHNEHGSQISIQKLHVENVLSFALWNTVWW